MQQPPKRIEAWFSVTPNVRFVPQQVANKTANSGVEIGAKSLSWVSPSVGTAVHEMAHMIDIDDARVCRPGWGFSYGELQSTMFGDYYIMSTDAAMRREVRVVAMQAVIARHLGFQLDLTYWASCLLHGSIPNYGMFLKRFGLEWKDPNINEYLAEIILGVAAQYSIDELWDEWVRKCGVVDQQVSNAEIKNGTN